MKNEKGSYISEHFLIDIVGEEIYRAKHSENKSSFGEFMKLTGEPFVLRPYDMMKDKQIPLGYATRDIKDNEKIEITIDPFGCMYSESVDFSPYNEEHLKYLGIKEEDIEKEPIEG